MHCQICDSNCESMYFNYETGEVEFICYECDLVINETLLEYEKEGEDGDNYID